MTYDDLVEHLGEFGPYQRKIYLLTCLPVLSAAIQTLLPVFTLATPDHRCSIPELTNDTYTTQSAGHQALQNHTLWRGGGDVSNPWGSGQCHTIVNRSATDPDALKGNFPFSNKTEKCDRWVYDTSTFDSTFVTQINIVCDAKSLRSHANMIYMAGVLIGSFVFGLVSDKIGRKKAILMSLVFHSVAAICTAFSPNFPVFAFLRFVTGLGDVGLFMCCFVLAMELVGRKWRAQAGVAVQYFWCAGMFVLVGMAYGIRNWKVLQIVPSCCTLVIFLLWWFIPESPRWLLSKGREEEARTILEKIARANRKELPKYIFDSEVESQAKGTLMDVFSHPVLAFRTVIIFINWLVVTVVYYGLTFNIGTLGGDIYVNFALNAGVETLGNVAAFLVLPRWGRKRFHCFAVLLSGLACLCSMLPVLLGTTDAWVTILLSNVGKFGATGGFATMFVYSAELYPTSLRNTVVGTSSMVARVGGMVSPYIADLGILVGGPFGPAVPYIVFGTCGVLAGLLTLFLPETLNQTLPETVQEAIDFGRIKITKVTEIAAPVENGDSQSIGRSTISNRVHGLNKVSTTNQGYLNTTFLVEKL